MIEAVIENVPLKQQIFADLEKLCSPECILSTNTSTIDINVCAGKMQQPHRIVGVRVRVVSAQLRAPVFSKNFHCLHRWTEFVPRVVFLGAEVGGASAGVHFFSPAHVMPLLEIVRTPNTPPQVVNDCIGLAAKIKKV